MLKDLPKDIPPGRKSAQPVPPLADPYPPLNAEISPAAPPQQTAVEREPESSLTVDQLSRGRAVPPAADLWVDRFERPDWNTASRSTESLSAEAERIQGIDGHQMRFETLTKVIAERHTKGEVRVQ